MSILIRAYKKIRRALRIKEIILISLRTLAMILFLLAVLKPVIWGSGFGGKRLHVFVTDVSLSMRAETTSKARFELAKEYIEQAIEDAKETDSYSFISFDSEIKGKAKESKTRSEAKQILSAMSVGYGSTRPEVILAEIDKRLKSVLEESGKPKVYVISDFGDKAWTETFESNQSNLKKLIEISETAELVLVNVAGGEANNLAVTSLTPSRGVFCVDLDFSMDSDISNFSLTPIESAVTFLRDQEVIIQKTKEVPPGEVVSFHINEKPNTMGHKVYSASIRPDDLEEDNVRYFSADIQKKLEVLVVDGRIGEEDFTSASSFLLRSMRPGDRDDLSPLSPEMMSLADFETSDIRLPDILILADVPALSEEKAKVIKKYVREGGSLLISSGPAMRTETLNLVLGGNDGILPVKLNESYTCEEGDWLTIDKVNLPESLNGIASLYKSGLKRLKLFSLLDVKPESGAEVFMSDEAGRPVLIARDIEKGRVLLWASSFDGGWTNLPVLPMFPPLIHELCYYLSQKGTTTYNLSVGDTLEFPAVIADTSSPATLLTPDNEEIKILIDPSDKRLLCKHGPLYLPGIYRLDLIQSGVKYFVVNVPAEESDLTSLSERAVKNLLEGVNFSYYSPSGASLSGLQKLPESLQRDLLFLALLFFLLETLLASIFSTPPKKNSFNFETEFFN